MRVALNMAWKTGGNRKSGIIHTNLMHFLMLFHRWGHSWWRGKSRIISPWKGGYFYFRQKFIRSLMLHTMYQMIKLFLNCSLITFESTIQDLQLNIFGRLLMPYIWTESPWCQCHLYCWLIGVLWWTTAANFRVCFVHWHLALGWMLFALCVCPWHSS